MNSVHQLAAPGRATVEASSTRLLDVVGQLEKRILELESGGRALVEARLVPFQESGDLLADAQEFLDANAPHKALECSPTRCWPASRNTPRRWSKKAAALDMLGRREEALSCCDRAIAADSALVLALSAEGRMLNRLGRYDEALNCFEQALLAQEKKTAAKATA